MIGDGGVGKAVGVRVDRQADGHVGRHAHQCTGIPTDRYINRQTGTSTERLVDREAY